MIRMKPWWQRTQISSQIVHVNTIFTVAVEKPEQIPKQVVYIVTMECPAVPFQLQTCYQYWVKSTECGTQSD